MAPGSDRGLTAVDARRWLRGLQLFHVERLLMIPTCLALTIVSGFFPADVRCTPADPSVCGPSLSGTWAVAFAFAIPILLLSAPTLGCVTAVALSLLGVRYDPVHVNHGWWAASGLLSVAVLAHLTLIRVRQQRVAEALTVRLPLTVPVRPHAPRVGRTRGLFIGAAAVTGIALTLIYQHKVSAKQDHLRQARPLVAVVQALHKGDYTVDLRVADVDEPVTIGVVTTGNYHAGQEVPVLADLTGHKPWVRLVAEPENPGGWLTFAILALLLAGVAAIRPVRIWWTRQRPNDDGLGLPVSLRWPRSRAAVLPVGGSGPAISKLKISGEFVAGLTGQPGWRARRRDWAPPPRSAYLIGQLRYGGIVQMISADGRTGADAVIGLPRLTLIHPWAAEPQPADLEGEHAPAETRATLAQGRSSGPTRVAASGSRSAGRPGAAASRHALVQALKFLIAGVVLLAAFVFALFLVDRDATYLHDHGVRVQGTVSQTSPDTGSSSGHIRVTYTAAGQVLQRPVDLGSEVSSYRVGQTVTVYYDPHRPGHMTIEGASNQPSWSVWLMIFLLVGGGVLIVIGVIALVRWFAAAAGSRRGRPPPSGEISGPESRAGQQRPFAPADPAFGQTPIDQAAAGGAGQAGPASAAPRHDVTAPAAGWQPVTPAPVPGQATVPLAGVDRADEVAERIEAVVLKKPTFGRRGYDEEEVDAFLDRVIAAFKGTGPPVASQDVGNAIFRRAPLGKRGYDEEEVDALLDMVALECERRWPSLPGSRPETNPGSGPVTVTEVRRQYQSERAGAFDNAHVGDVASSTLPAHGKPSGAEQKWGVCVGSAVATFVAMVFFSEVAFSIASQFGTSPRTGNAISDAVAVAVVVVAGGILVLHFWPLAQSRAALPAKTLVSLAAARASLPLLVWLAVEVAVLWLVVEGQASGFDLGKWLPTAGP